uniref:HDC09973 n=1 Tax=Drosophila melanogaster TaxID=7227 RepID=Q6IL98_DROME|nr:TPA_inf: HDC09973 [Drosophila melanogaster]
MRQGRWEVGLGGRCSVGAAGQRHMCAELYVAESDGEFSPIVSKGIIVLAENKGHGG